MTRIILRHISGSRSTEIEVIPWGAHRELILGRATSAAVRFDPERDAGVGRHHARLAASIEAPGHFTLADLGSRNGTYLNGHRLDRAAVLRPGDRFRLGQAGPELEFQVDNLATLGLDEPAGA